VQLLIDEASFVYVIPVCERAQLSQVVDLCAGIGAFSSLVHRLGFEVKLGIDHNKVWEQLFKTLHSQDTPFLVSDINSAQAIQALVHAGCFHCHVWWNFVQCLFSPWRPSRYE
jgi:predicted RNA methylase